MSRIKSHALTVNRASADPADWVSLECDNWIECAHLFNQAQARRIVKECEAQHIMVMPAEVSAPDNGDLYAAQVTMQPPNEDRAFTQ